MKVVGSHGKGIFSKFDVLQICHPEKVAKGWCGFPERKPSEKNNTGLKNQIGIPPREVRGVKQKNTVSNHHLGFGSHFSHKSFQVPKIWRVSNKITLLYGYFLGVGFPSLKLYVSIQLR